VLTTHDDELLRISSDLIVVAHYAGWW